SVVPQSIQHVEQGDHCFTRSRCADSLTGLWLMPPWGHPKLRLQGPTVLYKPRTLVGPTFGLRRAMGPVVSWSHSVRCCEVGIRCCRAPSCIPGRTIPLTM